MSDHDLIIDKFKRKVELATEYHKELLLSIHQKKRENSLEAILVEHFIMALAVEWENFVDELIVEYIVINPDSFIKEHEKRIKESISSKFGKSACNRIKFFRNKKIKHHLIRSLLDPDGRNITANTAEKLAEKANSLLSGGFARKFTLDADDMSVIDILICARNNIAHRSSKSARDLNAVLSKIDASGRNDCLVAKMDRIGTYLKVVTRHGYSRAVFIAIRIGEISDKLR